MLPPPTTTTSRPCNFTKMGKRLMSSNARLTLHTMGYRAEGQIAFDWPYRASREKGAKLLIGMAIEKLAKILVAFALGVKLFEPPLDGVGHGARRAAVANRSRDGSKLADAATYAEVVGVDHAVVLLDFFAFNADV